VAARVNAPSLGAAGYQAPDTWTGAVSYRWQRSDRHFVGDVEQTQRLTEHSEVINNINLLDVSVGYAFSKRFSASVSFPFQFATRSQVVRSNDVAKTILTRFSTEAVGLGDIRMLATAWLLDPDQNKKQNISLGLGVKFPTGEKDAVDTFQVFDTNSLQIVARTKTVDQSIQPGDGGYGIIADIYAFKEVFTNFNIFVAGTYIAAPQAKNGVNTFRYDPLLKTGNPFEAEMSIADQYLARAGFGYTFLPQYGLTFTLGGRIEGVPVRDLIGGSEGFRRPGFGVSIEPGLVYARKGWSASLSAPVALYRAREKSVPDNEFEVLKGKPQHGDAAFADFMVLGSIAKSF